jgi:heme-degrading monooxygenase HmoA
MYARVHRLDTTPDRHDQGLEITRDHLLPWLRESSGFCGLVRLVAAEGDEVVVVTLWQDAESLAASNEAAERLSEQAAIASGALGRSLREYEVTVLDLDRVSGQ